MIRIELAGGNKLTEKRKVFISSFLLEERNKIMWVGQRGLVFFFRLAHYKYLPTYFSQKFQFFFSRCGKKKLSLLVLLFKVHFFTPFTFFSNLLVFLQDQNSQVFALFIYALTSNLCFQPRFKLKILLPTTRFQDVFKLFVPLHVCNMS